MILLSTISELKDSLPYVEDKSVRYWRSQWIANLYEGLAKQSDAPTAKEHYAMKAMQWRSSHPRPLEMDPSTAALKELDASE